MFVFHRASAEPAGSCRNNKFVSYTYWVCVTHDATHSCFQVTNICLRNGMNLLNKRMFSIAILRINVMSYILLLKLSYCKIFGIVKY